MKMITLTTEVDFLIILKKKERKKGNIHKSMHRKFSPSLHVYWNLSVLPSSSMKLSEFFLVNPTGFL